MRTVLLSLAALLAAAPVAAQDAPPPASDTPSSAPASTNGTTFRGFRIEGDVGGDRYQSEGVHRDKLGYGASGGFDGQIGDRLVVGVEGSYWRANNYTQNVTAGRTGGTIADKSFDEYGVAVRAGVLLAPQLLVFGKGGYINNEQRKAFNNAPAGQTNFYNHFNTDGYQVGGGVELSMANRFQGPLSGLYVSAQYVYSRYDDHTSRQKLFGGGGIRFRTAARASAAARRRRGWGVSLPQVNHALGAGGRLAAGSSQGLCGSLCDRSDALAQPVLRGVRVVAAVPDHDIGAGVEQDGWRQDREPVLEPGHLDYPAHQRADQVGPGDQRGGGVHLGQRDRERALPPAFGEQRIRMPEPVTFGRDEEVLQAEERIEVQRPTGRRMVLAQNAHGRFLEQWPGKDAPRRA